MNYLLQAYACSPYKGGEYAVSWGWVRHLDERLNDGDILYVASLTLRKEDVVKYNLKHVVLLEIKGLEKYGFLNYNSIFYRIWQCKAYKELRKKKIEIDVIHIYSLSDYRQMGIWYKHKKSFKIFGPVGGGQVTPKSLKEYDTKQGWIREMINFYINHNPFYINHLNRFNKIYACNYETQRNIPKAVVLPDVPLNDRFFNLNIKEKKEKNETIRLLFVGRLINKKGVLLFLDVIEQLDKSMNFSVDIFGDGEQKNILEKSIYEKKLQNVVHMRGSVPYDEIEEAYINSDVFILPSLRESGGSVLVEAMAHKLPIVALDMAFARILNEKQCGLFIDVNQSKDKIIKDMANLIEQLIREPELRKKYGENGYSYVNKELNWKYMINEVYGRWIK